MCMYVTDVSEEQYWEMLREEEQRWKEKSIPVASRTQKAGIETQFKSRWEVVWAMLPVNTRPVYCNSTSLTKMLCSFWQ